MTEQQTNENTLSVLPRGEEARETFVNRVNELIKLNEAVEDQKVILKSAQDAYKDVIKVIVEDHMEATPDDDKKEVKATVELFMKEILEAEATVVMNRCDSVIGDVDIIRGKLV